MSHEHAHGHGGHHGHDHAATTDFGRAFKIGIALNLVYVAVEAGYGIAVDSLALLADAGHNLSDVAGLALSWGGAALATRAPTMRHTYGMRRATILAALGNALLLLGAVAVIGWEAVGRFADPSPVPGPTLIWVAAVGLVVNVGTALMFFGGRGHDLNIKSAFMHMAADALVTLGVLLSGVLIWWRGWTWIDPTVSIVIALVILYGTWGLLRDSVDLSLDGVPRGIDAEAVLTNLTDIDGVTSVHDLHIWAMSTTETALTAHLVLADGVRDADAVLAQANRVLDHDFDIAHATLQLERGPCPTTCTLAPNVG